MKKAFLILPMLAGISAAATTDVFDFGRTDSTTRGAINITKAVDTDAVPLPTTGDLQNMDGTYTITYVRGGGGSASAITVQTGTGTRTGQGDYNGFTLKLKDTFMEVENGPLSDLFQLESLTLSTPVEGGSGHLNPFKVAVYQYTTDGTIGDFVALSDQADWAASSSVTLDFHGIELQTNQQYQYLFVNSSATVEGLTDLTAPGSTLLGNYQAVSGKGRISLTQMTSLPGGDGTYTNNTINGWEGFYIPQVTFTGTTPAVPEPATATLSLLALAGLAVRRRRK